MVLHLDIKSQHNTQFHHHLHLNNILFFLVRTLVTRVAHKDHIHLKMHHHQELHYNLYILHHHLHRLERGEAVILAIKALDPVREAWRDGIKP